MIREKYSLNICNRLLIKLRMNGIDPTEAILFFSCQIEQMLACSPNYGPKTVRNKGLHVVDRDVWLLRGFYPETAQMFKISISTRDDNYPWNYYIKVSEPTIRATVKTRSRMSRYSTGWLPKYESHFTPKDIEEPLRERLEREILGVKDTKITRLISDSTIYTPRCISPKGMKLFKLSLKKG